VRGFRSVLRERLVNGKAGSSNSGSAWTCGDLKCVKRMRKGVGEEGMGIAV
jgi:hypothetical protein